MAFTPEISVCIADACKTLKVTDVTGVYDAATNPGGWEDVATVSAAEVASATLTIQTPGGSSTVTDVTAEIPNPVVGHFPFTDLVLPNNASWGDGSYLITYTIVTIPGAVNPGTYHGQICPYFLCNVECAVDKMWAKVASELCCATCDADELMDIAIVAEGYLRAIKSAISCSDPDTANTLLATLTKITTFNDCNCN